MPISAAARRLSATASNTLPATVRSKKSHAPLNTPSALTMVKKLW